MTIGWEQGFSLKTFLKYGLHMESNILCAVSLPPSQHKVTSTNSFWVSKLVRASLMWLMWLFQLKAYWLSSLQPILWCFTNAFIFEKVRLWLRSTVKCQQVTNIEPTNVLPTNRSSSNACEVWNGNEFT